MPMNNGDYTRTYGAPSSDGSFGRFYRDAILNHAASAAAGREIWEDVEMVEIILPGNPWTRPCERVTDEHRNRWKEGYAAFQREEEQRPEGRPLEEWPEISRAMLKELKALDMFTVEQVAQLSDTALQRLGPGARVLRQKAQAYVDEMKNMAPINALVQDNENLRNENEVLKRQVAELGQITERLQSQFNEFRNQAHPLATFRPADADPVELQRQNVGGAAQMPASSLDRMAGRRAPEKQVQPEPQQPSALSSLNKVKAPRKKPAAA